MKHLPTIVPGVVLGVTLCMTAAVTATCRPEETTRRKSGSAKSSGAATPATTPATGSSMARRATMDFSAPPSDPIEKPLHSTPMRPDKPGAVKAALADLDWIVVRQKQVAKLWLSLHTLADAKRHRAALIKGAMDVLRLTITSMRKAVALSAPGFAKFLSKQKAISTQTRQMGEDMRAKQAALKALPGGEEFFGRLKRTAAEKVEPHTKTLLLLGQQLLKRQNELKH